MIKLTSTETVSIIRQHNLFIKIDGVTFYHHLHNVHAIYTDGRTTHQLNAYAYYNWLRNELLDPYGIVHKQLVRLANAHRNRKLIELKTFEGPLHGHVLKSMIEWIAPKLNVKQRPVVTGTEPAPVYQYEEYGDYNPKAPYQEFYNGHDVAHKSPVLVIGNTGICKKGIFVASGEALVPGYDLVPYVQGRFISGKLQIAERNAILQQMHDFRLTSYTNSHKHFFLRQIAKVNHDSCLSVHQRFNRRIQIRQQFKAQQQAATKLMIHNDDLLWVRHQVQRGGQFVVITSRAVRVSKNEALTPHHGLVYLPNHIHVPIHLTADEQPIFQQTYDKLMTECWPKDRQITEREYNDSYADIFEAEDYQRLDQIEEELQRHAINTEWRTDDYEQLTPIQHFSTPRTVRPVFKIHPRIDSLLILEPSQQFRNQPRYRVATQDEEMDHFYQFCLQ